MNDEAVDKRFFVDLNADQRTRLLAKIFSLSTAETVAERARKLIARELAGIEKPTGFRLRSTPSLYNIRDEFARRRLTVEHDWFAAFLAVEATQNAETLERYQGWISAFYLGLMAFARARFESDRDYRGQSKRAMNSLRLGVRYDPKVLELLPLSEDLGEVIAKLDKAEKKYADVGKIADRLAPIRVLFEYAKTLDQPKTRASTTTRRSKSWRELSLDLDMSDDDVALVELRAHALEKTLVIDREYLDHDAPKTTTIYQTSAERRRSRNLTRRLHAGYKAADAIAVRQLFLSCDWRSMSRAEAITLYILCRREKGEHAITAAYLGASLILGRSIAHLAQIKLVAKPPKQPGDYWIKRQGRLGLITRPVLPTPRIGDAQRTLRYDQDRHFAELVLPDWIGRCLLPLIGEKAKPEPLQSDLDLEAEAPPDYAALARGLLHGWRKKTNRRLFPAMVSSFLPGELKRAGCDPTIIGHIVGWRAANRPSLYYTQLSTRDVEAAWEAHLRDVFKIDPPDRFQGDRKRLSGSQVIARSDHIREYFKRSRGQFEAFQPQTMTEYRIHHQAYVLLAYQLAALATGYRPIVAALADRSDVDLRGRFMIVSDKQSHDAASARFLPLCQTAVEQLKAYDQHLEHLSTLQPVVGDLAIFATEALTGRSHRQALSAEAAIDHEGTTSWFFYIENNRAASLQPILLQRLLDSRWPLPLNWQRHTLRTYLLSRKLPTELIDAFMGHTPLGEEALGSASGLGILDLRPVADEIERFFDRLGLAPVRGLDAGHV